MSDLKKLKENLSKSNRKIPESLIINLQEKILSMFVLKFLIENLFLFFRCNNLIESNILVCLNNSLKYLIEKIELYYGVIPFREFSNSTIEIPQNLLNLRKKARNLISLKDEEFVLIFF